MDLPLGNQRVKYLFSMMLGLAVTRCVRVPTSFTYSFESGGRLHLNGGGVEQHTQCCIAQQIELWEQAGRRATVTVCAL